MMFRVHLNVACNCFSAVLLTFHFTCSLAFVYAGERLTDSEVEMILKYTGTEEDLDGNIKYEGINYRHC